MEIKDKLIRQLEVDEQTGIVKQKKSNAILAMQIF
jgi:hypothetical protein